MNDEFQWLDQLNIQDKKETFNRYKFKHLGVLSNFFHSTEQLHLLESAAFLVKTLQTKPSSYVLPDKKSVVISSISIQGFTMIVYVLYKFHTFKIWYTVDRNDQQIFILAA